MTERITTITAAYDCVGVQPCVHGSPDCIPGSGGSHGRHNAELHMTARGPLCEVTLVVGTGWDLPSVPMDQRVAAHRRYPQGTFVELHTAWPRYEGQTPSTGQPAEGSTCQGWPGCYVDRGYLMADEPASLLATKGSEAVWVWLENMYVTTVSEMRVTITEQRCPHGFYHPDLCRTCTNKADDRQARSAP